MTLQCGVRVRAVEEPWAQRPFALLGLRLNVTAPLYYKRFEGQLKRQKRASGGILTENCFFVEDANFVTEERDVRVTANVRDGYFAKGIKVIIGNLDFKIHPAIRRCAI